jgi:hypothetical protein
MLINFRYDLYRLLLHVIIQNNVCIRYLYDILSNI